MAAPAVIAPIPAQIVNELASFGPFDLKKFIQAPDGAIVRFKAELKSGESLPTGMILTGDGILTGIPAKDTQGLHEIVVTAENDDGSIIATFPFTIKPTITNKEADNVDKLKSQVWEALGQNLPIPDLTELLNLPITALDVYYILESWGTLTIWDAFNLDPPSEKHLLKLEGASPHYNIYDRGSSLIMCPKELFSHERTPADAIQTAKAMAREVYKRGWTIEMAGLDKWTRGAWVELQLLGDHHGKRIEVINYTPSDEEFRLYTLEAAGSASHAPD